MGRDEKGRFLKGVTPEGAVPFNERTAKEMGKRSAEARKKSRTIAEMLRTYLETDAGEGNGKTHGDIVIEQAVKNHKAAGRTSFHDLRDLSAVLGEEVLNIKADGLQVVVKSKEEAAKIGDIGNIGC